MLESVVCKETLLSVVAKRGLFILFGASMNRSKGNTSMNSCKSVASLPFRLRF